MNVITVENLSFRYRRAKEYSLRDVSFEVRRGELLGIIGPSGSGKSTLCLTLNGIIPHSIRGDFSGEVIVRDPGTGEEYNTIETPVAKLSTVVGLVLQNPESQLFSMTVEEEIAFGLENLGLDRNEIMRRLRWVLEVSGLKGLEKEFPPNLSGGQKQRLAIAAVLAMKPSVLVLDEPTSQLDPLGRNEVLGLVLLLRKEHGITVVLVEHHTDYILRFADRIIVMDKGSIVLEGKPQEIAEEAETLRRLGINLPPSLEISYELKKRGLISRLALTEEELLSGIRSL
ncbi:ATP-binding cassette domain-containing protein [Thermococcus sp. GR7]|uniref:ATP-binding cassette domain-containing protein n=1 Tax=unclassified Thermococcus TaxID=2627626 RepID=UPI0014318F68|nr:MULTISPECIES: ATP-binding cassette domain-containing protein [unclassified Thermococcus]NJE46347.1 ATP-binding cassette domain-containing protein [Thermococcus sp. GR7]NJE77734.1 ATP-binding cassette domain-containing protein [Thermococcus sp. GR4]NJF23774.1 ATP-binding cassette domain-containing protein [Thermococcus sp. GR5]